MNIYKNTVFANVERERSQLFQYYWQYIVVCNRTPATLISYTARDPVSLGNWCKVAIGNSPTQHCFYISLVIAVRLFGGPMV